LDPIFDRTGKVIAWFRREDAIVDRLGQYRAFVSNGAVFDYQSRFLGRLYAGYIWDRDGRAVAFVMGAREGPVLPPTGAIPRPPVVGPEPARPSPQPVANPIAAYSGEWSEVEWEAFLGGKQKSDLSRIIR
jgi:hypothetical protein